MESSFVIIGAAKSATTSIYHYLRQHEGIFMPPERTLFEFLDFYTPDHEAFWQSYFEGARDEPVLGTKIAAALCFSSVAPKIHEVFRGSKLVVSLRKPVDRTYSHWWMRYEEGSERLPFREAILRNRERLKSEGELSLEAHRASGEREWPYLEQGHYAQHLCDYLRYFPQERLKVVLFEDFAADPLGTVKEVLSFVGANPDVPLAEEPPRMAGMGPLGRLIHRTGRLTGLIHLFSPKARGHIRNLFVALRDKRAAMDPEMRAWLIDYFRPHNQELAQLLGRDLSHWNE